MSPGPGRPLKKRPIGPRDLRHRIRIQSPISDVGLDGTPVAKADDAIDSANWTTIATAYASFKEIQGRLYLDKTAYSDQRVTLRHIDAQLITTRTRLVREDDKIFTVQTKAIDLDDLQQWCEVLAGEVTT